MDSVSNNVLCISQRPALKVNPKFGMLKEEKNRREVIADNRYPAMVLIQMQMAASDVMAQSAHSGSKKQNENVEVALKKYI